ncbi:MAG: TolC family protein [Oligoflexales bacterium]
MKFCLFIVLIFSGFVGNLSAAKDKQALHDPNLNSYHFHKKLSKAQLHSCKRFEGGDKLSINFKNEYDLDFLLTRLLEQNFTLRLNAERVYQAKHKVNLEIGKLLPNLSFATGQAAANNDLFSFASQMIGFIFPSNWFKFEESKLFLQAERWGHQVLQANQVNGLFALAYQINFLRAMHDMFADYRENLKELLIQATARLEHGEDRLDEKLKIENIYLMLISDQQQLEASIQNSYYQLAFVIDLDEDNWNDFGIEIIPFPNLDDMEKITASDLESVVLENSPEIMQFRYLLAATRYSARSRMFDFLNPYGNEKTSLGYGYLSQFRIGRSQTRELEIKLEELRANLKLAIYKVARDYNTALDYYKNIGTGLENAKNWYQLLKRKFFEGGEYDAQEFLDATDSILLFHSEFINVRYKFMVFQAIVDRLLMRGTYYQKLNDFVVQAPKKLSFKRKLENMKINKAIKAGELNLALD